MEMTKRIETIEKIEMIEMELINGYKAPEAFYWSAPSILGATQIACVK